MRVVIPVKNDNLDGEVDTSLGRCNYFLIYDTEERTQKYIENSAKTSHGGAGVLAGQVIADSGGQALITERCGIKAGEILDAAKVSIYKTKGTSIKENIEAFVNDELELLKERSSSKKGRGK